MNDNQALGLIAGLGVLAYFVSQNSQTQAQQEAYCGYYSSYGIPGGYGITKSQDIPGYYNTNYMPTMLTPGPYAGW